MIEQGHIEIINQKVIFVYYNLKKPNKENYNCAGFFDEFGFDLAMKLYKASKQTIEVENVKRKTEIGLRQSRKVRGYKVYVPVNSSAFIQTYYIGDKQIHDNQDCKAKIVNNKATIIELN